MREADVWQIVKAGLEPHGVMLQRIESAQTSSGIWDVNCTWAGIEFWLELKCKLSPLRPEQKAWGVKKSMAGARMSILNMNDKKTLQIWSVHTGIVQGKYPLVPDKEFSTDQWYVIRQYLTQSP